MLPIQREEHFSQAPIISLLSIFLRKIKVPLDEDHVYAPVLLTPLTLEPIRVIGVQ